MDATTIAPSPFLSGTKLQYAWDSTSLGYLKTCPRLYQYIMLEGWGHRAESVHLRFGSEFHAALQEFEIHLTEGLSHDDALRATLSDLLRRTWVRYDDGSSGPWVPEGPEKAVKLKNRASLIRSVIDYIDDHRDEPAKTYLLNDGSPAVELSFRFELDWGPTPDQPFLLCGHLDRVVEYSGSLYVRDYKTTTSTPGQYYFDQWSPSNQMTLYTVAAGVILDSPIKGVMIDAVQLLADSTRSRTGFTYRTKDQLEEWLSDLRYWFNLAESFASADYWPMNDTACDKFGGCRFREVCSKAPGVRDIYLKSKFDKLEEHERWNPLRPR